MDKLKLAHEYFMKHVNTEQYKHLDDEDLISWSFDYVDAMQAEADKREDKTRPEVLKKEWQPDTYPEYEHGRDYPSDAWVTFNGEARLAVSIKEDSLRKRQQ